MSEQTPEQTPSISAAITELPAQPPVRRTGGSSEDGSLVSEYGLVAVLGATIAGLAISWARGGAIVGLLDTVLRQVQSVIA